jgi:hypothetical protein
VIAVREVRGHGRVAAQSVCSLAGFPGGLWQMVVFLASLGSHACDPAAPADAPGEPLSAADAPPLGTPPSQPMMRIPSAHRPTTRAHVMIHLRAGSEPISGQPRAAPRQALARTTWERAPQSWRASYILQAE